VEWYREGESPSTTRTTLLTTNRTMAGLGSKKNHSIKAFIKFDVQFHTFLNSIVHGEDIITVMMGIKHISFTRIKDVLSYFQTKHLCSRIKYVRSIVSKGGMETISPG
jgi:hypothetical protein